MKILVIGTGAREHAIVWKLLQSPRVSKVFVAPGNAGTATIAQNINVPATDIPSLINVARQHKIDFTFVGPETPLSEGLVDQFQHAGLPVFGPTRTAARIEASKIFSKALMSKYGIPTAASQSFSNLDKAASYVKHHKLPIVIKADGLAAGKGVVIAQSTNEALDTLKSMMQDNALGDAGKCVVIEEYMTGREMSIFTFSDGVTLSPPVTACDYKRVFNNNEGPNTGGMGSFSPPDFYTPELSERAMREIMHPTIQALSSEDSPFTGVLYGGLMIHNSVTRTVEFNCRLGDPETQVILPRLKSDLVDITLAAIEKRLDKQVIEWSDEACVGVVMAAPGYPGHYPVGLPISGLSDVDNDVLVFHAGTKLDSDGKIATSGGRVLTVAAMGATLSQARQKVYNNLPRINFEGVHYRTDIAQF
ncbi:MAG: phosphoribosylamine--glycine ligase [Dehalococcoidia bacterium]|nr:phosphoribosylamine--glycine ligase [Dehalococcoidia bacterium]